MSSKMPHINDTDTQVYTCLWKIKNFSHCLRKVNECLESPSFVIDSFEKTKWCLRVYPRGVSDDKFIGCSLDRQISDKEKPRINIDFEVSFLDADKSAFMAFESKNVWFEVDENYGVSKFISRKEMFSRKSIFLPQDTLTICCRISINNCDSSHIVHSDPKHFLMRTLIAVDRKLFRWTIKDIAILKPSEEKTTLIEFTNTERFSLSISSIDEDKYAVQIYAVDCIPKCFMTCEISIVDAQMESHMSTRDEHVFEDKRGEQIWCFPEIITKTKLLEKKSMYLTNDYLTLQCELTASYGHTMNEIIEDISISDNDIKILNDRLESFGFVHYRTLDCNSTLTNDLTSLYRDRKFCDVTLQTQSKKFPVHKAVLCSRSPVFCAMFERDMKEKAKDAVSLPDLNDDTVELMISFLYTDTVKDLQWTSALQLYYASDLYEILPLKTACSYFLKSNISILNVCEVVILADLHQDEDLKTASKEYIFCHGGEIISSESWQNLEKSHPQLTNEILRWMYLKKLEE